MPRGNIALQYVIQNNIRKVWWCFLMISCTFWRSRKNSLIHQNYLVALMDKKFEHFRRIVNILVYWWVANHLFLQNVSDFGILMGYKRRHSGFNIRSNRGLQLIHCEIQCKAMCTVPVLLSPYPSQLRWCLPGVGLCSHSNASWRGWQLCGQEVVDPGWYCQWKENKIYCHSSLVLEA